MIDGNKYIDFVKQAKSDPVTFIEKFDPGIKLYPFQKVMLRMMNTKEKLVCYIPYRYRYPFK